MSWYYYFGAQKHPPDSTTLPVFPALEIPRPTSIQTSMLLDYIPLTDSHGGKPLTTTLDAATEIPNRQRVRKVYTGQHLHEK